MTEEITTLDDIETFDLAVDIDCIEGNVVAYQIRDTEFQGIVLSICSSESRPSRQSKENILLSVHPLCSVTSMKPLCKELPRVVEYWQTEEIEVITWKEVVGVVDAIDISGVKKVTKDYLMGTYDFSLSQLKKTGIICWRHLISYNISGDEEYDPALDEEVTISAFYDMFKAIYPACQEMDMILWYHFDPSNKDAEFFDTAKKYLFDPRLDTSVRSSRRSGREKGRELWLFVLNSLVSEVADETIKKGYSEARTRNRGGFSCASGMDGEIGVLMNVMKSLRYICQKKRSSSGIGRVMQFLKREYNAHSDVKEGEEKVYKIEFVPDPPSSSSEGEEEEEEGEGKRKRSRRVFTQEEQDDDNEEEEEEEEEEEASGSSDEEDDHFSVKSDSTVEEAGDTDEDNE